MFDINYFIMHDVWAIYSLYDVYVAFSAPVHR